MRIPKKGGYSGGKSAKDMAPPAKIPSETIKPREHDTTGDTCWCGPTVEQVNNTVKSPEPDWSLFVDAMRAVEERRALIADVDLPTEYAKAAVRVIPGLLADLDYARADARHWHAGWETATADVARQRQWLNEATERYELARLRERAAKQNAATHAVREGVQEALAREFARQAREGERLRIAVRRIVNNAAATMHGVSLKDRVVAVPLRELLEALGDSEES